jgi:hypothetical protein
MVDRWEGQSARNDPLSSGAPVALARLLLLSESGDGASDGRRPGREAGGSPEPNRLAGAFERF